MEPSCSLFAQETHWHFPEHFSTAKLSGHMEHVLESARGNVCCFLRKLCLLGIQIQWYFIQSENSNPVLIWPANHIALGDTQDWPGTSFWSMITVPKQSSDTFNLCIESTIKPLRSDMSCGRTQRIYHMETNAVWDWKWNKINGFGNSKIVIILHDLVFHYLNTCSHCSHTA